MKRGHGAFQFMRQIKIGAMVDIIPYSRAMPTPGAADAASDKPQSAASVGVETPTDDP